MKLALTLILLAATIAHAGEMAQIRVQVDQPGHAISPTLYGIFFEEINRAGDGGIYAEMIQNRSFEDPKLDLAWSLVKDADADGAMTLEKAEPLNAKNPTSLRLEVKQGRVGVANHGFRHDSKGASELAVERGKKYALSLYARGEMPVMVTLEKPDGTVLASAEITGVGKSWKKFEAQLTPNATVADARLVIAGKSAGTVWLDMVSLFPKEQLFRADLLKMLQEMKPSFMRFPGGTYVNGVNLSDSFRWKETIGDIAERRGHMNFVWGYRSSDGLGYHEYLQLCEELGCAPLYVVNCGISLVEQFDGKVLQNIAKHHHLPPFPKSIAEQPRGRDFPTDKLQEYVQDALDAIEYANGSVTSKWGALRAKAGHPAPFNLKFVEIGNENFGPMYERNYAIFHDAIKAKYPEMTLIANSSRGVPRNRPIEMITPHDYTTWPAEMCKQSTKYDHASRKGPKIYVGEYAVTSGLRGPNVGGAGNGNQQAAVAEAAFMTGLERNSDVVVMASYAPLFERVGHAMWNHNAIRFNAAQAYATPSWHVQTMFSRNRADVILPVRIERSQSATPGGAKATMLYAVAGRDDKAGDIVLKVVNAAQVPVETTVELQGAKAGRLHGQATVLSHPDPLAENSFESPDKIAPRSEQVDVASPTFTRAFPANSVTVLRLKAK